MRTVPLVLSLFSEQSINHLVENLLFQIESEADLHTQGVNRTGPRRLTPIPACTRPAPPSATGIDGYCAWKTFLDNHRDAPVNRLSGIPLQPGGDIGVDVDQNIKSLRRRIRQGFKDSPVNEGTQPEYTLPDLPG